MSTLLSGLKMRRPKLVRALPLFTAVLCLDAAVRGPAQAPPAYPARQSLTLDQCLHIAMQRNHTRPASQFAVAVAEAEHRQALAAYWPQITAQGGVEQMEHAPLFVYPATQMYIPAQTITTPAGQATVTIPANAFGPGAPPVNVQLPVSFPGQTINTQAQLFPVPAQNVKLMDTTTESLEGDLKWLLWDGGMRRGLSEQALGAVNAAQADARRTDLEVAGSVTRLYYGAVLARQLHALGDDTLARMEVTLRLTESLYKDGTGTVTKADYLDSKVMVESIRAMVASLAQNEAAAQAALAYTMGLSWNASVEPADAEVPYAPSTASLDDLVSTAYQFNPDWERLKAGLRALEGQRTEAESGYAPRLALTGALHRYWNSYGAGLAVSPNLQGWKVGAGVEIPIFDGFLTRAKVAEAQARINRLEQQKLVLKEGIGLQLRELFLQLKASEEAYTATRDAMQAAQDDSDLTTRGYGQGLLTTEKVIRAQIQQALVSSAYYRAVYEHRALESQIDQTVGREVEDALNTAR